MTPPTPQPARRGSLSLGLLIGMLVGLVVLGLVWALTPKSGVPVPQPTVTVTKTATVSPSARPSRTPTPTPPETPSQSPSATTDDRVVTSLESGTYFTVLDSLSKTSATVDAALVRAAQLGAGRPRPAVVVDTDALTPSLTPGYWAVGVPGARSEAESAAICAEYGVPVGGSCYPRRIG